MGVDEDRLLGGRNATLSSGITSVTREVVHHKESRWFTLCWEQGVSLGLSFGLLRSQFLVSLLLLFRRSKSSKVNRRVIFLIHYCSGVLWLELLEWV